MDFTALDRARSRLSWSRRELERFEQTADEADPRTLRTRCKLQEAIAKAERDLKHAQGREVRLGQAGVITKTAARRDIVDA